MPPATPAAATVAPASPTPGSPTPGSPEDQAMVRAQAAGQAFGGALKGRMKAAMEAGGPPQAITVCSQDAPRIAAEVSAAQDVRLGRASLRLRNPADAAPDWVQAWLDAQGERPAQGLAPQKSFAEVEGQPVARLIVPIAVEAACLRCHGAVEDLDPAVRASLASRYPQDRATGYAEGDLRGALWVEAPVQVPGEGGAAPEVPSEGG